MKNPQQPKSIKKILGRADLMPNHAERNSTKICCAHPACKYIAGLYYMDANVKETNEQCQAV